MVCWFCQTKQNEVNFCILHVQDANVGQFPQVKMSDAMCCSALNPDFQLLKARLPYMITVTNSANLNPPTTLSIRNLKQKGDIRC